MKLIRTVLALWALSFLWVNCTGGPPATDGDLPPYDGPSWEDLMADEIGPGHDDVLAPEAGKDPGAMDLALIARTADAMAPKIALGHGPLLKGDVPGFGEYARRCEQWLLDIAATARSGDAAMVRKLIVEGGTVHCEECHAALD